MSRRLSVTLEADDERVLSAFGTADSPERAALLAWAAHHQLDVPPNGSEAALVRVLLRAGVAVVREHVVDLGYASLAIELGQGDDAGPAQTEVREARRRYADRTDRVTR